MNIKFTDNSDGVIAAMLGAKLRALEKCGLVAEGYAKKIVPVGTPETTGIPGYVGGLLRNSITHAISGEPPNLKSYSSNDGSRTGSYSGSAPDELNPSVDSVIIGTNVEYAPYVEMGTGSKNTPGGRPDGWGYIDTEGNAHHTRGSKARPFLKPAVADHVQTYRKIIEGELEGE